MLGKVIINYEGMALAVAKILAHRTARISSDILKRCRVAGSCRNDGTITLNRCLQLVPEHLTAYIIYHELAHLIVRGHNQKFKAIIADQFPNYRQLDKELNLYGLKLLS